METRIEKKLQIKDIDNTLVCGFVAFVINRMMVWRIHEKNHSANKLNWMKLSLFFFSASKENVDCCDFYFIFTLFYFTFFPLKE